jgi:hypothetical protein
LRSPSCGEKLPFIHEIDRPALFAQGESSSASAGGRAPSQGLQGDNDFSDLLVAFEVPVSCDGLIEGEGAGDLRLERSVRQAIVYGPTASTLSKTY